MKTRERIWLGVLLLVLAGVSYAAWRVYLHAEIVDLYANAEASPERVSAWIDSWMPVNVHLEGVTLLELTMKIDRDDLTFRLLEEGADPNYRSRHWLSGTEAAVILGKLDVVAACIEHGGSLVANREVNDMPLLFYALQQPSGFPDNVRYLLEAGADPNFSDPIFGHSSIHSVRWGTPEVMRMFFEYGADLEVVSGSLKSTPIYYAVYENSLEKTRILVELGADTTAPYQDGSSLLQFARSFLKGDFDPERAEIVEYLESLEAFE